MSGSIAEKRLKKDQLIARIKSMHGEMKQLTLQAGVGAKRYEALAEKLEKRHPETLQSIHDHLFDMRSNEWAEVHRIWTLPTMTEDVWCNYLTLFGDTIFHEVRLLRFARKALHSKYVGFFKKKKKKKKAK